MENIYYEGIWTFHFKDGAKIELPGTLDINEYNLMAYCKEEGGILKNCQDQEQDIFHITGKTTSNVYITLYNCFFLSISPASTFLIKALVRYNYALFGAELAREEEQKFYGMELELSCFNNWPILNGFQEYAQYFGDIRFVSPMEGTGKNSMLSITFEEELTLAESLERIHEIRCLFMFIHYKYVAIRQTFLFARIGEAFEKTKLVFSSYSLKQTPKYQPIVLARLGKNLFCRWHNFYKIYK